jgi:hypothetical protein
MLKYKWVIEIVEEDEKRMEDERDYFSMSSCIQ